MLHLSVIFSEASCGTDSNKTPRGGFHLHAPFQRSNDSAPTARPPRWDGGSARTAGQTTPQITPGMEYKPGACPLQQNACHRISRRQIPLRPKDRRFIGWSLKHAGTPAIKPVDCDSSIRRQRGGPEYDAANNGSTTRMHRKQKDRDQPQ